MAEIVGGHLQFESVLGQFLFAHSGASGIVDEDVEAFLALDEFVGELAHGAQRGQVQVAHHHVAVARPLDDVVCAEKHKQKQNKTKPTPLRVAPVEPVVDDDVTSGGRRLFQVPASQDDSSASGGQVQRRFFAWRDEWPTPPDLINGSISQLLVRERRGRRTNAGVGSGDDDRFAVEPVFAGAHAQRGHQVELEDGQEEGQSQAELGRQTQVEQDGQHFYTGGGDVPTVCGGPVFVSTERRSQRPVRITRPPGRYHRTGQRATPRSQPR